MRNVVMLIRPLCVALLCALWAGAPVGSAGRQDQSGESASPSWVRVTERANFEPRDTADGFVYNGKMWMSNGYFGSEAAAYHDLWCSDDGVSWTLVNAATPYDDYSGMVVFQDKIWAIGRTVWSSTDGEHWTRISAKTPFGTGRSGEVVAFRGRIWRLGVDDDVWSTTDGLTWTQATERAPYGKRQAAALTAFNDRLWIMGGAIERTNRPRETTYPALTSFNDVWSSPDGIRWTRVVRHAPWSRRMWAKAKVHGGRIWLVGGFDNAGDRKNFNDTWFTEDGKRWRRWVSGSPYLARHAPTLYDFDGGLWIVAGNSWPLLNDVWRLTLHARTDQ